MALAGASAGADTGLQVIFFVGILRLFLQSRRGRKRGIIIHQLGRFNDFGFLLLLDANGVGTGFQNGFLYIFRIFVKM